MVVLIKYKTKWPSLEEKKSITKTSELKTKYWDALALKSCSSIVYTDFKIKKIHHFFENTNFFKISQKGKNIKSFKAAIN